MPWPAAVADAVAHPPGCPHRSPPVRLPAGPRRRPRRGASSCGCGSRRGSTRPRGCSRPSRRVRPVRVVRRRRRGPGLLIIDGLFAIDTRVADRTSTELLGAGDLLQPPDADQDEMVDCETVWRALRRPGWPCSTPSSPSACARGRRSCRRCSAAPSGASAELDVLRAISCQPRLEVRLVLLLWHLAGRWGRVEPTGLPALAAADPSPARPARGRRAAVDLARPAAGSPRPGSSPARAGDWHLHGSVDEPPGAADRAHRPPRPRSRRAADRDGIVSAMTTATGTRAAPPAPIAGRSTSCG